MLGGNLRRPAEGGAVADLSGTVEHAAGTAEAIVDGHLRPDDSFAASLGLSAATLSHAGWRIEGAEGWVGGVRPPGGDRQRRRGGQIAATADGPDVSLVAPSALDRGNRGRVAPTRRLRGCGWPMATG